ncbi:DUF1178 family protein, partial [Rhizobium leguminosarum]|uniref:DUF1178 family protein n=1 Tax=Rhizobium leguminosarum TaxID=384 RepID=UPI003F996788
EELADAGETFDIVLNMEVVEHVADVEFFMTTCAKMVRPGGLIFVGTQFPEEARKIHYGEADARGIIGQATFEEEQALLEEGIEIA